MVVHKSKQLAHIEMEMYFQALHQNVFLYFYTNLIMLTLALGNDSYSMCLLLEDKFQDTIYELFEDGTILLWQLIITDDPNLNSNSYTIYLGLWNNSLWV